jgi:dihydrofolate reductase
MRKLVYFIACTADGFISRADGSFDFFPMSGDHLPHIATHYPETIPGHLRDALGAHAENRHFDTVLMGRATFEVGSALGVTNPYPHLSQYLVSRTIQTSPDRAVQLVTQNPVELVRRLKRENGLDIWLCGGASLAGALYGEIDELILKVNPVLIGSGKPLFQQAVGVRPLALVSHDVFAGGVAIHRYRMQG